MSQLDHSTRIIIFAKTPLPGLVKTRLIPVLGEIRAAGLAGKMLSHTLTEALAARGRNNKLSVELCVAPDVRHGFWQQLTSETGVPLTSQGEGDLGDRLRRAADRVINEGGKVIFIGTDCPGMTADLLLSAADELERKDAVICPAVDGGYALLGLGRCQSSLFMDIPWSTRTVFSLTLQRLELAGFNTKCLEVLQDIDEPDDLAILPREWLQGEWKSVSCEIRGKDSPCTPSHQ